jgi:hypothetical protein
VHDAVPVAKTPPLITLNDVGVIVKQFICSENVAVISVLAGTFVPVGAVVRTVGGVVSTAAPVVNDEDAPLAIGLPAKSVTAVVIVIV